MEYWLKTVLLNKASEIIDEVIKTEDIYKEIDKEELFSNLSEIIEKSITERTVERLSITRETLKKGLKFFCYTMERKVIQQLKVSL